MFRPWFFLFLFIFTSPGFCLSGLCFSDKSDRNVTEGQAEKSFKTGQYTEALEQYKEAFTIYNSVQEWDGMARCIIRMSVCKARQREYDSVLEIFDSYEINPDEITDSLRAEYYDAKSMGYYYRYDNYSAIEVFKNVIALREPGGPDEKLLDAYRFQTILYLNAGLYIQAVRYAAKYKEVAVEVMGEISEPSADASNFQGMLARYTGEPQLGVLHYNRAIAICNELNKSGQDLPIGVLMNNLGKIYLRELKEYDKAYPLLMKALKLNIDADGLTGRQLGRQYSNVADYHLQVKNYDSARYYADKALELSINRDDGVTAVYGDMAYIGMIYLEQDQPRKAIGKYLEAYHFRQNELDELEDVEWEVFLDIGKAYMQLENYDSAFYYIQTGLESYIPALEEGIEQIPEFTEERPDRLKITEFLVAKARVLEAMSGKNSDYSEMAFNNYKAALNWLHEIRSAMYYGESKTYISGNMLEIIDDALLFAGRQYQRTGEMKYLQFIHDTMETNKWIQLKEELIVTNTRTAGSIGNQMKEDSLREKINQCNLLIHHPGSRDSLELVAALNEAKADLREFREKTRSGLGSITASVGEIQAHLLGDDEVLMEFIQGRDLLHQLIITADSIIYRNHDSGEINNGLNKLRKSITEHQPSTFNQVSYELYRRLIFPLDSMRGSQKLSRLLILPDGPLNELPFDILISRLPDDPSVFPKDHYLLQRWTTSRHLMLSTVLGKELPKGRTSVLAFTPEFSKERLASATRGDAVFNLPYAKKESNSIITLFDGQVFQGDRASETEFKDRSGNASILHLATHAILDREDPDQSYLMLAPDNHNDGLLYAYELYDLSMKSDLVVLSACNTGIGEYRTGEGNMSLARGFYYSGNHSILMSLWFVDDQATSDLMLAFYGYLHKGMSKDKALQKAKTDLLNKADNIHRNPLYWAGFELIGRRDAVVERGHWRMLGLIALGLVIITFGLVLIGSKKRRTVAT